ncbi:hypothetical protein [Fimbriiglobus ruber]|uniref:Uncharacterized protein n=1 Tax=Fimbriiglobus ruber TaxID=1908690 RepID=A0A225DCE5_9BACT|nr:hypothetical protein [Fimbriiglobus ruber]OWK34976.1 hypothetical protein FRUB_09818 [Fimbriiglobus ruber]
MPDIIVQDPMDPSAVLSAYLVVESDGGQQALNSEHRYREVWRCWVKTPLVTDYEVLNSSLLPAAGDSYKKYGYDFTVQAYILGTTIADPDAAVVNRTVTRVSENPYLRLVTVEYEGIGDPTLIPKEVSSTEMPYTEYQNYDANGRLVCNAAGDPYESGMPVDRQRTRWTIVSYWPYSAWTPDIGEKFRNTLNQSPWQVPMPQGPLTTQIPDGMGGMTTVPVTIAPRQAKIFGLNAEPILRTWGSTPQTTNWYWKVRAIVDVDTSTFTTTAGTTSFREWQWVVANVGFWELLPPTGGGSGAGKPHLITIDGKPLGNPWPLDANGKMIPPKVPGGSAPAVVYNAFVRHLPADWTPILQFLGQW